MKKTIPAVVGALITVVAFLATVDIQNPEKPPVTAGSTFSASDVDTTTATDSNGDRKAGESPVKVTDTEGIVPGGFIQARITRIVDGDTLEALYQNEEYKVRLLCVDTPETVKRGVDEQPYGKKATDALAEMTLDKEVTLVFEKDTEDRYDRLLAYILLEDGTCVNTVLVERGLARVDIVRPNNVHKDYFYAIQEKAIKAKKGFWSLPEDKRPFIKNEKGYYVPQYIKDDAA